MGRGDRRGLQDAAVMMMRRAQWFLMSLPMLVVWGPGCGVEKSEDASAERARRCLLEGSLAVAMRGAASSTGGSRLGGAPGTVFLRRAGRTARARARATVTVTATATDTTNPVVCVTHARERR